LCPLRPVGGEEVLRPAARPPLSPEPIRTPMGRGDRNGAAPHFVKLPDMVAMGFSLQMA
jgi:hypothetical protein